MFISSSPYILQANEKGKAKDYITKMQSVIYACYGLSKNAASNRVAAVGPKTTLQVPQVTAGSGP